MSPNTASRAASRGLPACRLRSRFRRLVAAVAASLLLTGTALAGEVTRLSIEVPPDAGVIAPGERVPIVVAGIDSAGRRVGFPGREVVIEADVGSVVVRKRPYSFEYRAPRALDRVVDVTIAASLDGLPHVKGTRTMRAGPGGTYIRLRLRPSAERVVYGGTVEIDVLGETREGRSIPLRDRELKVDVRGPGSVTTTAPGRVRYTAPSKPDPDKGKRAVVTARVRRNDAVRGEVEIHLVDAATPPPAPGAGDGESKPKHAFVDWPGGNVRVAVWRAWTPERRVDPTTGAVTAVDGSMSANERRLPEAGGDFVAPHDRQKIRVVVRRDDVVSLKIKTWQGVKRSADVRADGPGDRGPLRQTRNKRGELVAHIEVPTPTGFDISTKAVLILKLRDGTSIEERFVFRRGRDRDRDGERDRTRPPERR